MSDGEYPKIAARTPCQEDVVEGQEYAWCTCGLSKNQPWCDGSHRREATGMEPMRFTAAKTEKVSLCRCKATKNPPYCDGSHRNLPAEAPVTDMEDLVGGGKSKKSAKAAGPPAASGGTYEEPSLGIIKELAQNGLTNWGHHGEMDAMGVPGPELPLWVDLQFVVAQMAKKPLLDHVPVATELVIGRNAKKPLRLACPLFVSDMSFGALSEEAKLALAKGAELAGTGICSGEGGALPEEQAASSKYFYELASAQFGWSLDNVKNVQAFHFKGGQGAKTGTGGHLPGNKVQGKIASVRKLKEGEAAVSPATFGPELTTPADFKALADEVRRVSGGIPIGFKLSAQHIEDDIDFALQASAEYIILDGRGGGTGAAPKIFRDNISVPTIPALARARVHLDLRGRPDVALIATGGLRLPADFAKAMCLGADGIAISNSALQSIGCIAARMCNTNFCPAGIATQRPELRAKLDVDTSAQQLCNFIQASTSLMTVLARACGHDDLQKFNATDLTTWKREMADLTGVSFGGANDPARRIRQLEEELAQAKAKASGPNVPAAPITQTKEELVELVSTLLDEVERLKQANT